jgi:hypothetical protein
MSSNEMLKVGAPLPQSMGRCADLYHDVRELRLAMEKEVAAIAEREAEIKTHIVNNLSTSEDTGAAGLRYRAQLVTKRKPIIGPVSDEYPQGGWGILCSWIRKNDRFDMLQKRLSDKAVMDWQEQEKRVLPGIEMMNVKDVSITKI